MDQLVPIGAFETTVEAETARVILEQEGIQAFLKDAEMVNAVGLLGNAIGYIRLLVRAEDEDPARAILEEMVEHDKARESGERETESRCLSCGLPMPTDAPACPACGWSYANADAATEPEPGDSQFRGLEPLREQRRPFLLFWLFVWLGLPMLILALLIVAWVVSVIRGY